MHSWTRLRRIFFPHFALFLFVIASQMGVATQASAQGNASGFELALHGSEEFHPGKTARFRGVAYQVMGLAELRTLPNAKIRSRFVFDDGPSSWQQSKADNSGFFEIAIAIPKTVGEIALEVGVGKGKDERVFEFPLTLASGVIAEITTDRTLYEPGETIHAWAQFRDIHSMHPLASLATTISITGTSISEVKQTTAAHGVVSVSTQIPKGTRQGAYEFIVKSNGERFISHFRVGTKPDVVNSMQGGIRRKKRAILVVQ